MVHLRVRLTRSYALDTEPGVHYEAHFSASKAQMGLMGKMIEKRRRRNLAFRCRECRAVV